MRQTLPLLRKGDGRHMDTKEQEKVQKKQRITLILVSTLITLAIVFVFQTDAVASLLQSVKALFS